MSVFTATANQYVSLSTRLVTEECCRCHMLFAMPLVLKNQALADKSIQFFCPAGHSQIYTANKVKTLERQLQLEREEKQREFERRRDAERERDRHWSERKKLRTRHHNMRKRIQRGVCPCCKRSFEILGRHMKSKHPSFDYEPEPMK